MRITFGTKYNQMNYYQNVLQNKLNDMNTKIASGLKIQYGYQDSSINNQNLKLEYEKTTLDQGIDIAKNSHTSTLNTDKALSELSQTMVEFKTKLLQAANDIHSPNSREAIASDLEKLKDHIINIANTSIGGDFLFAGSKVDRPPFDGQGNYYGNNEKLNALISSNNLVPYNITGHELFFGRDSDKQKIITSNIKMLNQSKLHPDIMDAIHRTDTPQEVYIKPEDTLRDMIGDNDLDTTNDKKEFFYLRGIKPDGTAFKAKFSMDKAYKNKSDATTVNDLLTQIGKEFGNTPQNKVVDISLNAWGQIQIRDLKPGNSTIDFNLISSDVDVDNIEELQTKGARITSFNKSPFLTDRSLSTIQGRTDNYDFRYTRIPTAFIDKDNAAATKNTKLTDILGPDASVLEIKGTRPNNEDGTINTNPIEPLYMDIENATMQDLMDNIKNHFGGKLEVELSNGRLSIVDDNIKNKEHDSKTPPFDGEHGFSISLKTLDENKLETQAIPTDYENEYEKTYFINKGPKLLGNISQVLSDGSGFATPETKLSEVAGGSINGQSYTLKLNDHNGIPIEAQILFDDKGSYLKLPSKTPNKSEYIIPLYNPHDEPPAITITKANDVTYRQLMDAMSIALNYSNQNAQAYLAAENRDNTPTQENKKAYESLLEQAKRSVSINLTQNGKIEIQDNIHSLSKMRFMLYNDSTNDFSSQAIKNTTANIRLNANNALNIDEPDINFFEQIDDMIDSVRRGIYRPDSFGENYTQDMRKIGIQNGLSVFDHLSDHIEKMIALNGAHSKTFENIIRRNEVLKVQVESIKGETIGADLAETYNKFSNLTTNYNAVLASTSKINQMSLVNFL
ncbi:flagellar hook-associated protein FlgL [Helicobacter sp. 11S03491-1]|uniref:flagellar hook-associated protein FlgL n=1 Tax=Helicobacter sp. 11S03491-1 TaxID=1476196 RepID=UPI000BA5308C|nr:flagellar hook-associated protein FlgL [Helicobacter sp. 11S03491-1]PAF41870.1 flagellar biosynthesis protein FlgL [Helicobacter sp. 11S03491-1]